MILKLFVVLSLVKMTTSLQYYFDTSKGPVCYHMPVNIAIVIDSSISIGSQQKFDQGIEYIKKFLDEFYFNDTYRFTSVAAVMYGDRVYTESAFDFGTYNNKAETMNVISQFKWKRAAKSNTAKGINYMLDRFFPVGRTGIAGYTYVGFVFTNGRSENHTATAIAATRARGRGLKMIAVGVGPFYRGLAPIKNGDVNTEGLYAITGTYENFVTVGEVRKTKAIQDRIIQKHCTG